MDAEALPVLGLGASRRRVKRFPSRALALPVMGRDASRRRVGGFPSREEALPAGGLGGIPSREEALPAGGLGASRRWKRGFPPEGGGLPVVRIGASRFTVGGFPFREEGGLPDRNPVPWQPGALRRLRLAQRPHPWGGRKKMTPPLPSEWSKSSPMAAS